MFSLIEQAIKAIRHEDEETRLYKRIDRLVALNKILKMLDKQNEKEKLLDMSDIGWAKNQRQNEAQLKQEYGELYQEIVDKFRQIQFVLDTNPSLKIRVFNDWNYHIVALSDDKLSIDFLELDRFDNEQATME